MISKLTPHLVPPLNFPVSDNGTHIFCMSLIPPFSPPLVPNGSFLFFLAPVPFPIPIHFLTDSGSVQNLDILLVLYTIRPSEVTEERAATK